MKKIVNEIKNFWKEILIVLILTVVLNFLFNLIPNSSIVYSTKVIILNLISLSLPIFAAVYGGFIVTKRTKKLKHSMIIPAIGTGLAGFLLVSFSIIALLSISQSNWEQQFNLIKESMSLDITLEEFKSLTIYASLMGLVFLTTINFGLGLLGGLIGRWIKLNWFKK